MGEKIIGYARVSAHGEDGAAQTASLLGSGASEPHVFIDRGLRGNDRERPGLQRALAAASEGDVLVVTSLDRLGRSLTDVRDIAASLADKGVRLRVGDLEFDVQDRAGRLLADVLSMTADFESDVVRRRTREGMAAARAGGRLRGRRPKLTPAQRRHLRACYRSGDHTQAELADLFDVSRATIYREIQRMNRLDRRGSGPRGGRGTGAGLVPQPSSVAPTEQRESPIQPS